LSKETKQYYIVADRTGGGVEDSLTATSQEEAERLATDWIEDGEWGSEGVELREGEIARCETIALPIELFPAVRCINPEAEGADRRFEDNDGNIYTVSEDGELLDSSGEVVNIDRRDPETQDELPLADEGIDLWGKYEAEEPDCPVEEQDWDFVSVTEMGAEFGAHSLGGTVLVHGEVCRNTGVYRDIYDPGVQRNADEPLGITTYREPDQRSIKWIIEEHENDRGFIPEWLVDHIATLDREVWAQIVDDPAELGERYWELEVEELLEEVKDVSDDIYNTLLDADIMSYSHIDEIKDAVAEFREEIEQVEEEEQESESVKL
jgi:hypothetical protein